MQQFIRLHILPTNKQTKANQLTSAKQRCYCISKQEYMCTVIQLHLHQSLCICTFDWIELIWIELNLYMYTRPHFHIIFVKRIWNKRIQLFVNNQFLNWRTRSYYFFVWPTTPIPTPPPQSTTTTTRITTKQSKLSSLSMCFS